MVVHFITSVNVVVAIVFLMLRHVIVQVATNDQEVLQLSTTLIPAMLVSTYLNTMVSNITSGVFSGMGRPVLATLLSFGLELPLTLGGVAVYILVLHGTLEGVYWWQAISGGIELLIVMVLLYRSDWQQCADDAQRRQETSGTTTDTAAAAATIDDSHDDAGDPTVPLLEDSHFEEEP
jgi:MATE family multidrug resistance protein